MIHNRFFINFIFVLFFSTSLFAAYPQSPYIDSATWHELKPLFFPENHPTKTKLDALFQNKRISSDINSMKSAGFKIIGVRAPDKALVVKHPKLKGYILKLFLDDHIGMNDHFFLLSRIIGAKTIQKAIYDLGLTKSFIVPKKWLYPLPSHHPIKPGLERKNWVVIAEEIDIVDHEKNKNYFKKLSKERLHALYVLISTLGLSDSVFIKNIPFTKKGQIAFVDTERYYLYDIQYNQLTKYLNPECQALWKALTGQ